MELLVQHLPCCSHRLACKIVWGLQPVGGGEEGRRGGCVHGVMRGGGEGVCTVS